VNRPEQQLQRAVVQLLDLLYPPGSGVVSFHPPNGGWRSKREAAIMAGLGVRAGVSDLVLLWGAGAAVIELKAPGRGLADCSTAQHAFLGWCTTAGIEAFVCDSVPAVERALRGLVSRGMPEPESWRLRRARA
jgi:hypothetical protein